MASAELTQAQTMLAAYIAAEQAVLTGQSYTIGQRSLTRANLSEIRKGRNDWQAAVNRLVNGSGQGPRVTRIVPRDY